MKADKKFAREIDKLMVKCNFHTNDCEWRGTLKELIQHFAGCPFVRTSRCLMLMTL